MAKNALKKYNEKRNFDVTSEPKGTISDDRNTELRFVIQRHAATRLHYDFRLEWDGVLLSWAVPKGPSYYPKDKRLAVRTEDHPLSYADFEGIIPENHYGAGPVMVWDKGTWICLEKDMDKALKDGKIHFSMSGEKMKGAWTLARMHNGGNARENWLLMKSQGENATQKADNEFLRQTDFSVKSGRSFNDIAAANGNIAKAKRPEKKHSGTSLKKLQKAYKSPQLATLADEPPAGDGWTHEVKYDGYRILVYFSNGQVKILTRNGKEWMERFPVLAEAFEKLEVGDFVIDGEAVMINAKGLSDFKALQNGLDQPDARMRAYFFDLLYWNGEDFAGRQFLERRKALEQLFDEFPEGPLYLSEVIEGEAASVIDQACRLGLEGIISKKISAKYTQKRSKNWVKSKCESRQEFIICGFIKSTAIKNAVGALHIGYNDDEGLKYAGKVGTGFSHKTATDLYEKLMDLAQKTHPFDDHPDGSHSGTQWVKPELLCEVKFATWTSNGKVRHASYQGLRQDKLPERIVKEKPANTKEVDNKTPSKAASSRLVADVGGVKMSHPDRKIFPDAHVTKADLAEFYAAMDDWISPSLVKRPVSVVRCPGGIDKQCFFQRSKGKGMPDHIYTIDIEHEGKSHEYLYVKTTTGLVELVQMGAIEMHPWGVKIDNTEKPDRVIFDLDPHEDVPFEAVKLAAMDVRNRLNELGLDSFVKCTGGKGLHVTVPIQRRHNWETVKGFSRDFAARMQKDVPDAYTCTMSKKKRKGKIFIDYFRNDFASTAVMDYCVRARPGAAVAVPLQWEELDSLEAASQFSIEDVLQRKKERALFDYPPVSQSLTKDILEEVAG